MILKVKRTYKKENYTIGNLYIDDVWFANTLEDKDRGLKDTMSLQEIKKIKVQNKTAIPTGTYTVTLNVISPKFSKKQFYVDTCKGRVPRLLNVKGYDGILIHVGDGVNGQYKTAGCILVGRNTIKGGLTQGKETFISLYSKLSEANKAGEKITITIE